MKRLIIGGAILFALAATLYLGLFWLLCNIEVGGTPFVFRVSKVLNWKGGRSYLKFQEFDKKAYYDVVTIGSSHADRGYDPRIFKAYGYNTFDLGTKAQSPMNTYYIVKHFLDSTNTGLLLIDTYKSAMETDGLESTADLTQNITANGAALGMSWGLKDPRTVNMLTLRMMMRDHGPFYLDSTYVGSGFSVNERKAPNDIKYSNNVDGVLNEQQWNYFIRVLALCQERSIPVVLVDHPAPKETQGPQVSELGQRIVEAAEKFDLPFLDHTYNHNLNSRLHFYDHTHLNQAGVEKFNGELIPEMQAKGILKRK